MSSACTKSKSLRKTRHWPSILPAALLSAGLIGPLVADEAHAQSVSQLPLFLIGEPVKPNIMLIVDDSGSMDSEVLMPTNDGALWWRTGSHQSFVGLDANDNIDTSGILNFNRGGGAGSNWKKYTYLFPNGTGTGNRVYSDSNHDHYAIPPVGPFAYLRSPDYNGMYYDPSVTYHPWVSEGGHTFGNVDPTAAPSDPTRGNATFDLTVVREDTSNNWRFRMQDGMILPAGTEYYDGSWNTTSGDIEWETQESIGIKYYPATYYLTVGTGDYTVHNGTTTVTGSCASPDPAHYVHFQNRPGDFSSTDVDALAYDGHCLQHHVIEPDTAEMQNFANWFTYYRNRHSATRAGIGSAFDGLEFMRTGAFTINSRSLRGMWDYDDADDRETMFSYIYDLGGNSGGTPNREALNFAGQQFNSNSNVVQFACQQNFALLFTDGYSNVWTGAGVGNADGTMGSPFADTHSNTIADIAAHYYLNPLRANDDFTRGLVPTPPGCGSDDAPPWLDCNDDLHMVTFGITLGAQGHIFGVTHHNVQDAHDNPPAWQNPSQTRNPVQVDDLYHAAVNSRGEILSARTATELQQALRDALEMILDRRISTAASVATNSTRIDTDTLVYQAKFDTDGWSGQMLAFSINADGSVGDVVWDTDDAGKIPNHGSRNIFTHDGNSGVNFTWGNLSAEQKDHLADGDGETAGQNRLNWIRGDQSNEGPGQLRMRAKILGDIVNSDPFVVSAPRALPGYSSQGPEGSYGSFIAAHLNRTPMLYVGANDGMLHAFKAGDGEDAATEGGKEVFAYVPKAVFPNLVELTKPGYDHLYYVDGSPYVGDAYVNGAWRSVLLGPLGAGGRGLFALDVTNPGSVTASNVLWDINADDDSDFGDLGHMIGQIGRPVIGPMKNGDWAAVFGNGYASGSGAHLFIVNLANGNLIKKITVSNDSDNGLSAPALVRDGTGTVIGAYAGDLQGNLWKFDLTSSSTSNWDVAFKQDPNPRPLFVARNDDDEIQAITAPLETAPHPDGGRLIMFGTGQFFEIGDLSDKDVQSLYGVWDTAKLVVDNGDLIWEGGSAINTPNQPKRDDLVQQELLHEVSLSGNQWRTVSRHPVNWGTLQNPNKRGWYIDLISPAHGEQGERVVSRPQLRSGQVLFTTLIPTIEEDPCLPGGGTSWIIAVDMFTGGRSGEIVFDVNQDGKFDEDDMYNIGTDEAPVLIPLSGYQSGQGIIKAPALLNLDETIRLYTAGTDGGDVEQSGTLADRLGRQGWRQLR